MTSTYANEAKSAIDNAVAPQKPEKIIPLVENSRGMFRDVIEEFGINDEYFGIGQADMEQRCQQHDCEDSGNGNTQASRSAAQCMRSKDYLRESQLSYLERIVNEHAEKVQDGTPYSEIGHNRLAQTVEFIGRLKENLAAAQSEYLGALELYDAHFDKFQSAEDKREAGKTEIKQGAEALASVLGDFDKYKAA